MNEQNFELLKVRVLAFLFEAFSLLLTTIAGVLISEEFRALVIEHFGVGLTGSVVLLLVSGLAKHLHNIQVIRKVELGSISRRAKILI